MRTPVTKINHPSTASLKIATVKPFRENYYTWKYLPSIPASADDLVLFYILAPETLQVVDLVWGEHLAARQHLFAQRSESADS
jgi:hypothetical protein